MDWNGHKMMLGHLKKTCQITNRETAKNLHQNQFTYDYYAIQFQHTFYDFVGDL